MKSIKQTLFVVVALAIFVVISIVFYNKSRPVKVSTEERIFVPAHVQVKFIYGEPLTIGNERLEIIKHVNKTVNPLTGKVLSEGCYLTFPGKDYGSASSDDAELNSVAKRISDAANLELSKFGDSPFHFESDIASVWNRDCDIKAIYIKVDLWFTNGQHQSEGFLTFTEDHGHQEAWIHIPVAFYDGVLRAAAEKTEFNLTLVSFPEITEVGGYRILPDDPNGLGAWLAGRSAFLQNVYGRSTEITFAPAKYNYTKTTNSTRFTGSGCNDRNYANYGSCSDWGPSYETTTNTNKYEIDVVVGTMVIK